MKAIVLLGGQGTRLRPLTYTTPKQLLPVVEVPMLERVLAQLRAHGVDEAVLSLGYRPDAFFAAYPGHQAAGVRLDYAVEPEPLDTAGAIAFAARHAAIDETFIVVNGDVLTDLDTTALVAFHRSHGAAATIHLKAVEDPSRFGVVPIDADGRVIEFVEKPPADRVPTNLINAGTYVLEPSVLALIPLERRVSVEREIFPALVADGTVFAMASEAYWLDTGTPEAYLQANADLLGGVRPGPPAPDARQVSLGVWTLGAPVVRGEVLAPSLLGAGAQVAAEATVTASVLGARSTVEHGARVEHSVLLPGARVGAGARVSGSILGHDCVVAEGCELLPVTVVGDDVVVPEGARLTDARVPAEMAS
ncbi:MAG TPA: NDP-sugar synthase [Acidimicrobiales bacterium]|nr:NDP-sugar synthase [Acidimicrobiales bacterium]HLN43613.1 NDP-sugar synthase [Acidimicrobiales bacterium]